MIETFESMKHGKSSSYENAALSRTANQILHHMEDKDSEDNLESTRARVLGKSEPLPSMLWTRTNRLCGSKRKSNLWPKSPPGRDLLRGNLFAKHRRRDRGA